MKKIAILASDNMMSGHPEERGDSFERDEEMGKLVPAFAAQGMSLDLVRWREAAQRADEYDAMLPLLVWDYFEGNEAAFTVEMAKVEAKTQLFNSFKTLSWNANKSYLDELEHEGAPVISTITVNRVTEAGVARAFEELETDTLVIKPQVGGYRPSCQVLSKKANIPSFISEVNFRMASLSVRKKVITVFNPFMEAQKRPMSRARKSAPRRARC